MHEYAVSRSLFVNEIQLIREYDVAGSFPGSTFALVGECHMLKVSYHSLGVYEGLLHRPKVRSSCRLRLAFV